MRQPRESAGRPAKGEELAADRPQVKDNGQALGQAAKSVGASRRTAQKAKAVTQADPANFESVKARLPSMAAPS
jgi:hypothetical protein